MMSDPAGDLITAAQAFGAKLVAIAVSPASPVSLISLTAALLLGAAFILSMRGRRGRPVSLKVLVRALFPRRITHAASTRTDLGFTLFNIFAFGALFGWGLLSYRVVGAAAGQGLAHLFGAPSPSGLADPAAGAILTVAMFLAYELGFWIDHYTSHHIRFFWEIHKVHHTATVLTPLTIFRVHPIESIKLFNILAVVMGATFAVVSYLIGKPVVQMELFGKNVILLMLMIGISHLQHTHLWIAFTGALGRVAISPAHHQIHHSDNPDDFGKNLGGYLAVWDWAFGTLRVPPPKRPAGLTFGVAPASASDHSFASVAIKPVRDALRQLGGAGDQPAAPASVRP
jgi:sterol desaturase/sphingolipid hydroxylase (fatty acid hydroxylase superfamily)